MNYTFDSIAGYEEEKAELKRICDIFNNQEVYKNKGANLPKGLILYGAAGTGKTLFAKVLSSQCNMPFETIDLTDVSRPQSIYRKIKGAFDKAKQHSCTTTVFFDEIDKFLPNSDEEYYTDQSKSILTQLLTLIDGINSTQSVFFVATCNSYDALPTSLVRPGRIDKKIHVDCPSLPSRKKILEMYISRTKCTFEAPIEAIAKESAGLSCAALETLVNECVLQSDDNNHVSAEVMYATLYSLNDEDIVRQTPTACIKLFAAHTVGHYIVGQALHPCESTINRDGKDCCNEHYDNLQETDVDDDDYDDYDDYDDDPPEVMRTSFLSKIDYLELMTVKIGGAIGEEIFYGKQTSYCGEDLMDLRRIFLTMAYNGLLGLDYLYSSRLNDDFPYPDKMLDELNELYYKILHETANCAREIVLQNKKLGDVLMRMLKDNPVLDQAQIEFASAEAGSVKPYVHKWTV